MGDEAAFSFQSSLHSLRSSLSEEAEAGPSLVSSLVPAPPLVPARRAKVLNSHSQNFYNGNANSSLPRRTTFVGDSPPQYGLSVSPNDLERVPRNLLHRHLSPLDHSRLKKLFLCFQYQTELTVVTGLLP